MLYLQLEWRALSTALSATDEAARRAAVSDALELDEGLAEQAAIPASPKPDEARYDGVALRAAEQARDAERRQLIATYRTQLVDGPVLRIGFLHMKIEFDPRNVIALDQLGSVYPTLRVIDEWGVLEVTGGALLAADYAAVTVAAPAGQQDKHLLTGAGWSLKLAAGWHLVPGLVPGARAGDVQLAPQRLAR